MNASEGQPTPSVPRAYLDDAGLLRVGPAWVAIPDTQLPLVQLLLDRCDRVVRTDEVVESYVIAGGSDDTRAIRTMLTRLAMRLSRVGLQLVTIRARGVLLTWAPRLELGPGGVYV